MDNATAAELKATLQGIALPAGKAELLEYAVQQRAEPSQLEALQSLPDRRFDSLDGVVEELVRAQPDREDDGPSRPREESGAPPGNADYTRANPPDTGKVRD